MYHGKGIERGSAPELLNSFLSTELASINTYEKILKKADQKMPGEQLRRIQKEHEEVARLLGMRIADLGVAPVKPTKDPEDVMSVLADTAGAPSEDPFAIKALKEREEENLLNYENAQAMPELDGEVRSWIGSSLVPKAREHIAVLNGLLNGT